MDIEQYDSSDPEKYLKGILHSEQEPWVGLAYQSYLAVLPSSLVGFDDFAKKVMSENRSVKRKAREFIALAGAINFERSSRPSRRFA